MKNFLLATALLFFVSFCSRKEDPTPQNKLASTNQSLTFTGWSKDTTKLYYLDGTYDTWELNGGIHVKIDNDIAFITPLGVDDSIKATYRNDSLFIMKQVFKRKEVDSVLVVSGFGVIKGDKIAISDSIIVTYLNSTSKLIVAKYRN